MKGDNPLSRLHAGHCNDGIVHQIIIDSINKSVYMFYKTFKQALHQGLSWGSCYTCDEAHIY